MSHTNQAKSKGDLFMKKNMQGFTLIELMVVLVIIFLTEITSNTATAAAFLPLLGFLTIFLPDNRQKA